MGRRIRRAKPWLVGAISGVVTALAHFNRRAYGLCSRGEITKIVTAELGATAMATMSMVTPLVAVLGLVSRAYADSHRRAGLGIGAASTLANKIEKRSQ